MIFIIIFSIALIWLHVSSLRFIIKAGNDQSIMKKSLELEEYMNESKSDFSFKSFSTILSLGVIAFLSLIEIGYFIYCVYFFNDLIVVIGSSILAGYTIYSFIKFLPNIKKFFKKPLEYLKEKTQGFESVLNLMMTSLEILFCAYILVKVIIKYKFFS
mgnify:CR=1 FL=1